MNDEFWDLAERLVPDHGMAETIQGELIRTVVRLTAECSRNGCGNWDGYYETLLEFARDKFSDGTLDAALAQRAQAILERLRSYGRSVGDPDVWEFNQPPDPPQSEADEERVYGELCRDLDEPLEEAAVAWCRHHPTLIPFQPDPDYGASD